jgi:hypothetical protein
MYVRQLLVSNASASAVQVQAVAAAQHDAAAAKEQLTAFKAEAARDAVMAAEKYEALKIKFNLADAKVDTGVSEGCDAAAVIMLLFLLLLLLLLLLPVTFITATVKDLRRQVADFKSDIVKLQDQLKHREAEASEAQRKVCPPRDVYVALLTSHISGDGIDIADKYARKTFGASQRLGS